MLSATNPRLQLGAWQLALSSALLAPLVCLLPGCSGGGGAPPPAASPPTLQSLAGVVRSSDGTPLAGVRVAALGGALAGTSDAFGIFVLIGAMPLGTIPVTFDGSAVAGGSFPVLTLNAVLDGGANDFPRAVSLPDLSQGVAQAVATDAAGESGAPIALALGDEFGLAGAADTLITLDGLPAVSQTVELGLTRIEAIGIPSELPAGAVGQSFLSVEPWNAAFDTDGAGKGLDVEFENPGLLAVDTLLDVYWFDSQASIWINRSAQTGIRGKVVDHAGVTRIDAPGLATEGGIYAPALPLCAPCAWSLDSSVRLSDGTPVAGAAVALSTGQFAQTAADGTFALSAVAGYDAQASQASPPIGSPIAVAWSVVLPAALGGDWTTGQFPAGSVVPGGTLSTTLTVAASPMGLLAGRVQASASLVGSSELIELEALDSQGTPQFVQPESDGSFFFSHLAVGGYQAGYAFPSAPADPVLVGAEILTSKVTTVVLVEGAPFDAVDVLVVLDDDGDLETAALPQPGARVTVAGANGTAGARTTGADGKARFFGLEEPLTVTAQFDRDSGGGTKLRLASTLTEVLAQAAVVSVPLIHEPAAPFVVKDAKLVGTVSNVTLGPTETIGVVVFAHGLAAGESAVSKVRAVQNNSYSLNVPSGVPLTVVALKSGLDGLASVQARELILAQALPPVASQATATQDFDFAGSGLVAIDQTTSVTFAGQLMGSSYTEVSLLLGDGNGLDGRLPIAAYPPNVPNGVLLLPDLGAPGLGGAVYGLGSGGEGSAEDFYCSLAFSSTPTTVDFPLGSPAVFTNPTQGMSASSDQFAALTVSVSGAAGGTPAGWSGVNLLSIRGSAQLGSGVTAMDWTLWLPEDQDSIALPVTSWPMFSGGNTADFGMNRYRFDSGQAFDYATFFDVDLASKLVGLVTTLSGECESFAEVEVLVTTP